MQKVVTVNVLARTGTSNDVPNFLELEFPILNKYLEEGYTVKAVHQIAPSPSLYSATFTFILEKPSR